MEIFLVNINKQKELINRIALSILALESIVLLLDIYYLHTQIIGKIAMIFIIISFIFGFVWKLIINQHYKKIGSIFINEDNLVVKLNSVSNIYDYEKILIEVIYDGYVGGPVNSKTLAWRDGYRNHITLITNNRIIFNSAFYLENKVRSDMFLQILHVVNKKYSNVVIEKTKPILSI